MPPRLTTPSLAGQFEGIRSDYNAAKSSRYRRRRSGVPAQGAGADWHYASESDYLKLLEQARDFDRNDVVVSQLVDRAITNTIQEGIRLDPATGDKGLDLELWNRWEAWATDPDACDFSGELCFYEVEQLVPRATIVDGDMFALLTDTGHLQLVESHRCRTPQTIKNAVHGVELDAHRRRLAYWFTKDDVGSGRVNIRASESARTDARDAEGYRQVLHVYSPKRVTQTRGVTAFAPIFDALGMFEDINFANLVRQQVVSCFAIFRERDIADSSDPAPQTGTQQKTPRSDGTTQTVEGIAPGMQVTGAPGEKLQGFAPNVPGPQFFEHVRLILTLIGINLGMPLVLVLLDASETNFSGFRGAVDQARLGFRRNQRWLVNRLHAPCYRWKVREWLREDPALRTVHESSQKGTGRIDAFAHRWNSPRWPYIEPLKDASADLLRQRNGLISPRRLHAERGGDWEEIAAEIVEDNAYAIRRAKTAAARINQEFPGDPVHWRELISLPTPDGLSVSLAAASVGDESPPRRAAT